MRTLITLLLLFPLASSAQFSGGLGRGDAALRFQSAPLLSSVYTGGSGRGDVALRFQTAPIASNIYTGGDGRGDVALRFQSAPIASNIYAGGDGRGDVALRFQSAPVASNIYTGGDGRGDVALRFQSAPVTSNIYTGGDGRGDVALRFQSVPIPSSIYAGGAGRGDVALRFSNQQVQQLLLALRGMLEGPYNSTTGQMSDALRTAGIVPTIEPYTALGYAQVGGGGAESITPAVLATTGPNAIVDWVVVELRDANTPTTVLATRSALIQRDGDIVATDGVSPLTFNNAPGTYHVALRHRNHLGVMTGNARALGLSTTPLDLSSAGTATFGTDARKSITGSFPTQALWAGDVNFDGLLKYIGDANDRDLILQAIGGELPTNAITGYHQADVNLNGMVKYLGAVNDRDPILLNLGGETPAAVRVQQLP